MWRTLGPLEGIIGVLMCGLSASFLFAIVTRLVEREARFSGELEKPLRSLYIDAERLEPERAQHRRKNRSQSS